MYRFSSYSGMEMDAIAFGTYQIPPGEVCYKTVSEAIECGYRSFDTATFYDNEADVGKAIKASKLPIHITTKVWNDMQGYEKALESGQRSRDTLGVEAIDLLLIHWPTQDTNTMLKTWEALEKLKEDGVTKYIGVSNFKIHHLQKIEEAGFSRPESNQIEVNPMMTQEPLRAFCQEHGIIIEAWRPLIKANLHYLEPIEAIAKKYNKSLAQVAIRWAISSGMRVLAKSSHKERMLENINVFDFDLSSKEIQEIDKLNQDLRQGPDPDVFAS